MGSGGACHTHSQSVRGRRDRQSAPLAQASRPSRIRPHRGPHRRPQTRVHILGGRITRSLASYLSIHLEVVRDGVSVLPESQSLWPQHALSMRQGDVLVVFDVRRYESSLYEVAELAKARGLVIVLFTDQWMSPIASLAAHALPLRIEVPSSWDSNVVPLFVIEALIAAVVNMLWPDAAERMKELETLFDSTKRFRK